VVEENYKDVTLRLRTNSYQRGLVSSTDLELALAIQRALRAVIEAFTLF